VVNALLPAETLLLGSAVVWYFAGRWREPWSRRLASGGDRGAQPAVAVDDIVAVALELHVQQHDVEPGRRQLDVDRVGVVRNRRRLDVHQAGRASPITAAVAVAEWPARTPGRSAVSVASSPQEVHMLME
jgi:hypothetical protein